MEISSAHPLLHSKFLKPLISFPAPPSLPIFQCKASFLASNSALSQSSKSFLTQLQGVGIKTRQQWSVGAIHASKAENPPTDVSERWLLVPVGDGDTRHIGYNVKMPDAFEIASKKQGNLLVTDLDSTNGTFIDEKRLRPGVVSTASTGSRIIFGDIHLAMFRVSKLNTVEVASKAEEYEDKQETDKPTETTETG
ncbi:uncharacterized protein LOC122292851 isoform X2 [Carya illinoinensis]|uniref:uncharacterized protein LOC122292851 isoform X2 n=1 Tax=Carya illinoinensis TaxID=32201 RepID=UPI001C724F2B|nr:uncharacterized protein LOC122292851 isoform X2 [Carya illinoinensis]